MSLALSSTLSPFPYAATALAAYTKQAELVFDDGAEGVNLDLSGTVISGEEKIVEELAKGGSLSSDSTTVRPVVISVRGGRPIPCFRPQFSSHRRGRLQKQPLIQKLLPRWKGSTTDSLTELS